MGKRSRQKKEAEQKERSARSLARPRWMIASAIVLVLSCVLFWYSRSTSVMKDALPSIPVSAPKADAWKAPLLGPSGKPPQFVVFAFDGSKSNDMWEETRAFARQMTEAGTPLHFTYFINGVYFIPKERASIYQGPHHAPGQSAIGWAESPASILTRATEVNQAFAEGNEIGSHATGHWDGSAWSKADWEQEFAEFYKLVFHAPENNPELGDKAPGAAVTIGEQSIVGFRAPELGVSDGLYPTLKELGYRYDASQVANGDTWPVRGKAGLWEFPLGSMKIGTPPHWTISMDYSVYTLQSGAVDDAKKGTLLWQKYHDDMLNAYRAYFEKNYAGNHAPVFIAHHFAKWNDGAYWEAMKDFAKEVCGKPEVQCVTYSRLADYMDTAEAAMQNGSLPKDAFGSKTTLSSQGSMQAPVISPVQESDKHEE